MSKAIGWDIGIKNLAYCVLESQITNSSENSFTFNNQIYNIDKWEDISLVTQIESNLATSGQVSHINNTLTCCGTKNTSKKLKVNPLDNPLDNTSQSTIVCGKKAFYAKEELSETGEYQGLCKTHFKKLKIARLPILSVKTCWTDSCCAKPIKVLKSHIFKGFCKKHINDMNKAKTHTDDDFFKINHAKTTAKIDINQLGIALFQELNKKKESITEPNIILLENQPVLKNPTMKSMQMFLYSYYLMNILDSNIELSTKKLQCYCASKKLDMIKYLPEDEQTSINTFIETVTNPYQKNKKMAIMMVEVLLKNNAKWLEYYKSHPKKDDLADSLLMTLHYFTKNTIKTPVNDVNEVNKVNEVKKENAPARKSRKSELIEGVKTSKITIIDDEGSAMLDATKSKKRNRLINKANHKKKDDEDDD